MLIKLCYRMTLSYSKFIYEKMIKNLKLQTIMKMKTSKIYWIIIPMLTPFIISGQIAEFENASNTSVQTVKNTNANGYSVIDFKTNDGDQVMGIGYANAMTAWNSGNAYVGVGLSKDLTFMMSGIERMRLTSDGYVGVRTNLPFSPLHVASDPNAISSYFSGFILSNELEESDQHAVIVARSAGSDGGDSWIALDVFNEVGWAIGIDNDDYNKLKFGTNVEELDDGTKMTLDTSGNFGIGTTQPTLKLDLLNVDSLNTEPMIKVQNNAPRGYAGMEFYDYQGTNTLQFGYANINTNFNAGNSFINIERDNTPFNVLMQGEEKLRLTPKGNFGIGFHSPIAPLSVRSDTGAINLGMIDESGILVWNDNEDTDQHSVLMSRSAGPAGGDPIMAFDVYNEGGWVIGVDNDDDNKLKFGTDQINLGLQNKMTLKGNGNFGIGTDDPMATLDINGRLRIQDVPNTGSGDLLVIDGNGDVSKLGGIALKSAIEASIKKDISIDSEQIKNLVQENKMLKERIDQMEKAINQITSNKKGASLDTRNINFNNNESKQ